MLPNKLHCVTFLTRTGQIYKQARICKFDLILMKQLQNSGVYYREDKPHHVYEIADNKTLNVIDTLYNLSEEQQNAVHDLNEELYNGQAEHLFYEGEESDFSCFTDEAYETLHGFIVYPQFVSKSKAKVNEFCKNIYMKDVQREADSVQRTIDMYNDDNEKTSKSFEKVAIDTTVNVTELKIGDAFYRYVEGVGVLNFELKEIIEVAHINRNIYHLLCTSCNHGQPCEVYVSHVVKDRYSYVGNVYENSEHDYYHNDDKYHFRTSKKAAFQDYLNKIHNYNSKVLSEYKERRELLHHMKVIATQITN